MSVNPLIIGSEDYYRKRFTERIWDWEAGDFLLVHDESEGDKAVSQLVEGLLTEIGF